MKLEFEDIKKYYLTHGIPFEEINIFGIRNEDGQDLDIFNDYICIAAYGNVFRFKGTCDPGKYWTLYGGANESRNGVAHICYGYHKNVYVIGSHYGKPALVQRGNQIKIWRDKNKNYKQDQNEKIESGYFGVNIHRASDDAIKIGRWSAGCIVIRRDSDFETFMELIKQSSQKKFSLLILDINDFDISVRYVLDFKTSEV